jgi:hypothetical protein
VQIKIRQNIVLTKRQKILNSILIWLLPFVWYYLIRDLIDDHPNVMTKKQRDAMLKKHHRDPHSYKNGISSSGSNHGF